MIGRYVFSIVIGTIVTLSLLFVMQLLIVTGKTALTDPRERHKLEFVRVKRNENLNLADLTPEKPPKPPETPPETPPQELDNINPDAPTINVFDSVDGVVGPVIRVGGAVDLVPAL